MTHPNFEAEARHALSRLGPDPGNWIPDRPGIDANVAIVGAGHTGLTLAFALRRAGIGKVIVLDAAEHGSESIWRHRARMLTLRTPKLSLGPDLDLPEITFQAWYEAKHGRDAFAKLGRPLTSDWADYLDWFRSFAAIDVAHGHQLTDVRPDEGHLRLTVQTAAGDRSLAVRKLVLATGLTGSGGPFVPDIIATNLPGSLYAHSLDLIDFSRLRGKKVAVLGVGASGFDQAAAALEAGAGEVHVFSRAAEVASGGKFRAAAYPGGEYFHRLPDAERWRLVRSYLDRGSSPPVDSVTRATRHPNFFIHLASPWEEVLTRNGQVQVFSRGEEFLFDYVIAATGFTTDPTLRPELASVAGDIALWEDRYTPPADEADPRLGRFPYLGPEYQFTEKRPGEAPHLRNIHAFNYSGFLDFARILGDIASLRVAVPRLVRGIGRDLFDDDREAHLARMAGSVTGELTPAHYEQSVWRSKAAAESA